MKVDEPDYREKVYDLVGQIPRGRVMTYGQVAAILGEGYTAAYGWLRDAWSQ